MRQSLPSFHCPSQTVQYGFALHTHRGQTEPYHTVLPSPQPKLPELLAPAGTLEASITAFDAGADAAYAGLDRFNARERGWEKAVGFLSS